MKDVTIDVMEDVTMDVTQNVQKFQFLNAFAMLLPRGHMAIAGYRSPQP